MARVVEVKIKEERWKPEEQDRIAKSRMHCGQLNSVRGREVARGEEKGEGGGVGIY
jgi:hypothetical protein